MILKGSQRGGAKQLGLHLMKMDENDHVEVHEVRGFVSEDMAGALKEAYAVSRGTRCRQFLFSLSLSPPRTANAPVGLFEDALERIEKKLGLEGQPRIVVFHEKEGRRHAHAVWSRIDADTMTARNLPFFKFRLRDVSRALYMEHGWTMPRGLMNSEERDPRNFTLSEWQQAKRMGRSARDLKAMIQECWAASDSRAAFVQALGERGLVLARGDRRGHVAVTHEGEVLSIARYAGKTAKEVRARLGPAEDLPGVAEARAQAARDMGAAFRRHAQEAAGWKRRDLAMLERRRLEMRARHRADRARLDEAQKRRWLEETKGRSARLNRGLLGLWHRITGQQARIRRQNETEAQAALRRDREERQRLIDAQLAERQQHQARVQTLRHGYSGMLRDIRRERDRISRAVRMLDAEPAPAPRRRRRSAEIEPEP